AHQGVLLEPRGARGGDRRAGGAAAAMWLSVEHRTRFAYDAPIVEAHTELRLKPAHRNGQRCSSFEVQTEPRGASVEEHEDRFLTWTHHFDLLEPHTALVVSVRSEVWTGERYHDETQPSPLDRWDFLQATRYVPLNGALNELAGTVAPRPTAAA